MGHYISCFAYIKTANFCWVISLPTITRVDHESLAALTLTITISQCAICMHNI